jgi:hypothetical protein
LSCIVWSLLNGWTGAWEKAVFTPRRWLFHKCSRHNDRAVVTTYDSDAHGITQHLLNKQTPILWEPRNATCDKGRSATRSNSP